MATYLYTWNPDRWTWADQADAIYRVNNNLPYDMFWSCGNTRKIAVGDTFLLTRVGVAPKGIIGSSSVDRFKVTAKGLDFIEDDGGLTAILGTVTVRFDEGTLRALMAEKVKLADISQPEKSKLLSGIQSLSGDAIRHLTLKLLDKGVESIPRAIEIIGNSLT